jgi:2-amino-4-hydroxy-6-hydroxymethyldihydropteridine diphosphokinase
MILLALGANLPGRSGSPRATIETVIETLANEAGEIVARSPLYRSTPEPPSSQPDYVNAVVALKTELGPVELLALLHRIEERFGRERGAPNAARTIDLDLLAYDALVRSAADGPPVLPHPRMQDRAFVLLPLRDVAPNWRHPLFGLTAAELIARLPLGQTATRLT